MRSRPFFRNLDTNGDGTGSVAANVDGSSTPVVFKYTATKRVCLHRLIVGIEDNANLSADGYGGLSQLTNGITGGLYSASGVDYGLWGAGLAVRSLAEWAFLCYDMTAHTFGSGNNFASVRWTFSNSGSPVYMEPGDEFRIYVNDNLSGLVAHYFHMQGFEGWTMHPILNG